MQQWAPMRAPCRCWQVSDFGKTGTSILPCKYCSSLCMTVTAAAEPQQRWWLKCWDSLCWVLFPSVCGEILYVSTEVAAALEPPTQTSSPSSHVGCQTFEAYFLFEYTATFAFPFLIFLPGFLSPSVNEAWAPQGHSSDLWLTGKSPYGPRHSALTASHLGVSGLSADVFWCEHFKRLERVWLNRLSFLAQDRL